jgi:hypothetical protein
VGGVLVEKLDEQELEGGIFVVVNLLNAGSPPTNPPQQIQIAELNLQAACKTVWLSAFKSAGVQNYYQSINGKNRTN